MTLSELLALSPESDCARINSGEFASESRVVQWLAWRVLLRRIAPDIEDIQYDKNGAPIAVAAVPVYISVSHSTDLVAVMVASGRCGIDIELKSRNFMRARSKFASCEEIARVGLESENGSAGLIWCAKEAIYKWAGVQGVDFMKDIEVLSFAHQVAQDIDPGSAICNKAGVLRCRFRSETIDVTLLDHPDMFVVYCGQIDK